MTNIFEPPKFEKPVIFKRPGPPIGTCSRCRRNFPLEELQEYYNNPTDKYWLCGKCRFRKEVRAKFSGKF